MKTPEKCIEHVIVNFNKSDEERSAAEYIKEKDKEKNDLYSKNDFNKITYIDYDKINLKNSEVDFLFDYSKILGKEKNDTKIIQWQMLNKDRLFPYEIDIKLLSERINKLQKNNSNKMTSIISNLNYRMQRHGRLAPTKDIARKLQKKSIDEQVPLVEEEEIDGDKEIDIEHEDILDEKNNNNNKDKENDKNSNTFYNGNEENFYDINDPFIDDNLDELSEVDDNKLLFRMTLAPGNYTEKEILQNLKKNQKVKKFKKIKKNTQSSRKEKKDDDIETNNNNNYNNQENIKDSDSMINAINNIINKNQPKNSKTQDTTFLSKKTKREPSYNSHNSDNEKNRKKRKFDKSQLTDMSYDNINKLFKQILSEYTSPIITDQQKISFINRNIKNITEIYSRNPNDLCKVIEKEFKIDLDIAIILMEYAIFKSKIENIYSNFSKYLKLLNLALKNNGISKISSLADLIKYANTDNEIEKSIKHVIDNIYNFRVCFNEYIGKHYNDLYEIHDKLSPFIKDIKERNKGIILKLSCRFDEIEKDFEGKIPREIIIEYLKSKYNKTNFRENFINDRNRIYSLDVFVYKDKGNNTKIYKDPILEENKENKFDLNNKNNDNKTNNNNDNIYQKDPDSYFNNLSFEKAISTSISSPAKYPIRNNSKFVNIYNNKDKNNH